MRYLYSLSDPLEGMSPDLLGGKGFGLMKMHHQKIPVPPAFIISTLACKDYFVAPEVTMESLRKNHIPRMIEELTAAFGFMPLVSVRSGAKFSMPGMMDTILNVGLDALNEEEWAARIGRECTEDSRKRLIEMYGSVVCGIDREHFAGKTLPEREFVFKQVMKGPFPDAAEQLEKSIEAVFKSWNNERAKTYRALNGIPHDLGTAVVIQAMVFGNMNDKSCTGVLFTRDPSTGDKNIVGEYLVNAQGEDVVAGIRTPESFAGLSKWNPKVAGALKKIALKLEKVNCDAQDIEFTVQSGKLFILQTRNAKRTAQAAIKIAVDLHAEGVIGRKEALSRVTYKQFLSATRPVICPQWKAENPAHGKGIPASNGVAVGTAVFSSAAALKFNGDCVLIAEETTPDDIAGMNAAVGILTQTGGATSHAAVVARGMDKVCVTGCESLFFGKTWTLNGEAERIIKEGVSTVVIDGATGEIWIDEAPVVIDGSTKPEVQALRQMAREEYQTYEVCTSVDEVKGKSFVLIRASTARGSDKLLAMMEAFNGEAMVVDTRPSLHLLSAVDAEFVNSLSNNALDIYAELENARAALEAYKGDREKVKVIGPFCPEGYVLLPSVSSLEQLLNVEGLCLADFEKLSKLVGGTHNIKRIVDLRRKAGELILSFNILSQRVEPSVIGKSTVAMSERVLLASVLAA